MTPREIVLAQIQHRETEQIPYTLPFEQEVGLRLDAHYGGPAWRQRLVPYVVSVAAVETDIRIPIDEGHARDGYGGVWRVDRRPWHLEIPPLSEERRRQLANMVKEKAEDARVAIRNVRRDANRQTDQAEKDKAVSEDQAHDLKNEIQDLTKKFEGQVDENLKKKTDEILEV